MDLIKGATYTVQVTFYSYWSGQAATSIPANITGATLKLYAKLRDGDSDANALFVKNGTVVDGPNGIASFTIAAADTNYLSYASVAWEAVAKLADGTTYIRNGANHDALNLLPNVGKTLF